MVRPSGLDASTRALLAAMTVQPDALHRQVYDTIIKQLKAADIWARIDEFRWFASHDSQAALINWMAPSAPLLTANGNVSFIVNGGYKTPDLSGWLRLPFGLETANYTLNNSSFFGWCVDNTDSLSANDVIDFGVRDTSPVRCDAAIRIKGSANLYAGINNGGGLISAPNPTPKGFYHIQRVSSTTERVYKNAVKIAETTSTPSVKIPEGTPSILRATANGVSNLFPSPRTIGLYGSGQSLLGKESEFYSIIKSGMNALGVYE